MKYEIISNLSKLKGEGDNVKMNDYYVYIYYRLDTNEPFYVGKGKGDRWKIINRNNKHFMNIINKHPIAVEIEKDNLTESEAFYWEEKIIKILIFEYGYSIDIKNNYSNEKGCHLVNCTWGGEGVSRPHTEEWKIQHSKDMKGENHPNYGKHLSEETREKMRKKKLDWWNNLTEEEYKKYLSNRPNHKGGNNPSARSVICLNTGEIFECLRYASIKYNTCEPAIRCCCNKKYKTAGGVTWMYYDEYLDVTNDEISYRLKRSEERLDTSGKNNGNAKSIICLNDKRIFFTSIEASEYYGISKYAINKVVTGKNKSCGKKIGKELKFKRLIWKHNKKYKIKK